MTAKFTDMLAKKGLNIERLETTVSLSADGQPIFNIACDATAPPSIDMASVGTGVAELEDSLGVAIMMEDALGRAAIEK
jgi:glycine cleavage system regulatory protein